MGDSRLAGPDQNTEIADTQGFLGQIVKYLDARRVAKRLEQGCRVLTLFIGNQLVIKMLQDILVYAKFLTANFFLNHNITLLQLGSYPHSLYYL